MTKEFIPYEQALTLKELGFDEPCVAFYYGQLNRLEIGFNWTNEGCKNSLLEEIVSAPLYQQAFRWFREKKIHSIVQEYDINNYMFSIDDGINRDIEVTGYDSYEKAELECLKQLIKIVKDEKSKSNS